MDQRLFIITIVIFFRRFLLSFGQICKFHHLNADCRYRIDGISMVQILVGINQCNDPVDVTFRLKCGNPQIDWQYTFVNSNELKDVPGFDVEIGLQVKQGFSKTNTYMVEADFQVENLPKADFMKEEIHLTIPDNCLTVNEGGRIAIGVLVSLVIVVAIALVIVLLIRWRRKNQALLNNSTLVTNAVPPGQTNPPVVHYNNQADNLQFTSNMEHCDPVTEKNGRNMTHPRDSVPHERY